MSTITFNDLPQDMSLEEFAATDYMYDIASKIPGSGDTRRERVMDAMMYEYDRYLGIPVA